MAQAALESHRGCGCSSCCRLEAMLSLSLRPLGAWVADGEAQKWLEAKAERSRQEGPPGRVYLSLEPNFSISSCRGANSLLSIKLNSCTKKMKCLKEVLR